MEGHFSSNSKYLAWINGQIACYRCVHHLLELESATWPSSPDKRTLNFAYNICSHISKMKLVFVLLIYLLSTFYSAILLPASIVGGLICLLIFISCCVYYRWTRWEHLFLFILHHLRKFVLKYYGIQVCISGEGWQNWICIAKSV